MIPRLLLAELVLFVAILPPVLKYGLPWLTWLPAPLGLILFLGLFVALERAVMAIWCRGLSE